MGCDGIVGTCPDCVCPECEECEECPEIPEPTMWAFYLSNATDDWLRIWVDTDAYTVYVPDGIVAPGRRELIKYLEEGNHYFYMRTVPDTGVFWQEAHYLDAEYTLYMY